jgi:hypothetical protein
MKQIEDTINTLVENHFPQFYKEEGSTFVEFTKEYYKWLESTNNTLYYARNLLEFRDIDTTIDDFLVHYKNKYLVDAPVFYDKTRANVKHSLDFYRSKGTERGTKLLFREVWSIPEIEVYYPGRDVLQASDGTWVVPTYLELSVSDKTKTFVGKRVVGSISGASAFVEKVSRRSFDGKLFDVMYLADVVGDFVYNELITSDGSLAGCPTVIGSLTGVSIDSGGSGFSVGDVVEVVSQRRGKLGLARVDAVLESTGKVEFTLINGGTGYGSNTVVSVANLTVTVSNVVSSNVFINNFITDETVYQPLANLAFNTSNVYFDYGTLVIGANTTANVASGHVVGKVQQQISGVATANSSSNTVVGVGTKFITEFDPGDYIVFQACTSPFQISSITSNSSLQLTTVGPDVVGNTMVVSSGSVLVIVDSGDFSLADRVFGTSANITAYTDRTASGKVIGSNTGAVGFVNVSNTFTGNQYNYIYGATSNVYANVMIVGTGSGATFAVGSITPQDILRVNSDLIQPYVNTALNATSYSFPKLTSANLSSIINNTLEYDDYSVGTIASISGISSGNNYNITPFVLVRDSIVTKEEIVGVYLSLDDQAGTFSDTEIVTQVQTKPSYTLAASGSNTSMDVYETATQTINSTSNVYGRVVSSNTSVLNIVTSGSFVNSNIGSDLTGTVTANSSDPQVNGVSTLFTSEVSVGDFIKFSGNSLVFQVNSISNDTVLFLTSNAATLTAGNTLAKVTNVVVGMTSGALFFVNASSSNTYSVTASGIVARVDQSTTNSLSSSLLINPITPSIPFVSGSVIDGVDSGASANVAAKSFVSNILVGNNAVVNVYAGIQSGSISEASVVDSGYAYEQGEIITLISSTGSASARGQAVLSKQGVGQGYFSSTRGFLNSDKYLHDGDFYQSFSYQVKASVPLDVYGDTLKKLSHIAGTKLFGNLVRVSSVNTSITPIGLQIET